MRPLTPAAGARQFWASCWGGARGRGYDSAHSGGVGAPPGDTTIPCQELADRRANAGKRGPTLNENAAAERREARRPTSLAGHLRRSGDGSAREADHGCGVPHQRLSALCSPHFFGDGKQTKGHPRAAQAGGGALASALIGHADCAARPRSPRRRREKRKAGLARDYALNFTIFCFCSPRPWMPSVTTSPAFSHTGVGLHAERRRPAACRW